MLHNSSLMALTHDPSTRLSHAFASGRWICGPCFLQRYMQHCRWNRQLRTPTCTTSRARYRRNVATLSSSTSPQESYQQFRLANLREFKSFQISHLWNSIAGLLFSSLCYFIEREEEDTEYTSIPNAFYWVVITMTTVGYGEITPAASLTRMLTGMQAILGTMFVAIFIGRIVGRLK